MLGDYGFRISCLVLRTKADCSGAKTKFLVDYELLFAFAFAVQDTSLRSINVPPISYSGRG